ncbi:hypothetical protein PYW08_013860 [Mythimna loreyi]|uniref:Uncharacterized protein n=1 Tax=Mythimna loreyi TaxID=667449 RepID=A0ACC2R5Y0_9NEOP|nr:hypothetical protein PYW08_013860 [Mythimna loreyi]
MGDSKNRKMPPKQKASSNSKRKSSSDQKENAPKREKTKTRPDPDEGIAMSKQLLLKKSNARTQRRTSSKPERICPNGKPIPSLSELEKMFDDSDEDQTPKPKRTPSTPENPSPSDIIDNNLILPTTINKITERLMGSIQTQNLPSPDELLEAAALLRDKSPPRTTVVIPPKKRKAPEVPYIVGCKDRPQVAQKPCTRFCKGDDDYGVEASAQDPEDEIPTKRAKKSKIPKYTKSIFNAQSDEIAERLIKDDAGDLSDASSDSNKTIEYDPTPIQTPRPLSFSPLPSTSSDQKIFEKNDELYNESLKENNTSTDSTPKNADDDSINKLTDETMEDDITLAKHSTPIKKDDALIKKKSDAKIKVKKLIKEKSTLNINEDDVQIIDIPHDTIEIEDIHDRTVQIRSTANNAINTNDIIEIIDPVESEIVKAKENNNVDKIHGDDDCMIITSSGRNNNHNNVKNLNESTIVIDDEYSSINMEFDSFNDEPIEIIDVDDIIAENNTILHKWKKNKNNELHNINTVVEVPNTAVTLSTPQTTVAPITPQTTAASITPQTTVAPSNPQTAVASRTPQTTVSPSTPRTTVASSAPQTTVAPSTPRITVAPSSPQTTATSSTPQSTVAPSTPRTTVDSSTPQTTVAPSTEVQTTSPPTTASPTLQAEAIPNTSRQTRSTSTPNYDSDMTSSDNDSETNDPYPSIHFSYINTDRHLRFRSIVNDFFKTINRRQPQLSSVFESGNRITSLLTRMINRLESPNNSSYPRPTNNQTSRPTSNQTSRPTSNQTSRPTSNQTSRHTGNQTSRHTHNQRSRPTSNQTSRPTSDHTSRSTSNHTSRPTSNQTPRPANRPHSHPVNTAMPDTTSVFQNAISTLQNAVSSHSDQGLRNSETQQTRQTDTPIPARNIGDCPICLDPLNSSNGIASTICGHVFCLNCIQASVRTNGKKCPTCRKALKGAGGGYHQLYL